MDAGSIIPVDLFVERIPEAYTGIPLLGVGGYCASAASDTRIEVHYDDELAVQLKPEYRESERRYHFATQLPIEANTRRVRIVLSASGDKTLLFDQPLDQVGTRAQPAAEPQSLRTRMLRTLQRGLHSLISGEILSLWRWRARLARLHELQIRARQKLRGKLLRRRYPNRSIHDAYIENTSLSPSVLQALQAECTRFRYRPKISILLPVFNSQPRWLKPAVESVFAQIYTNWELCISDDASTVREHYPLIKEWAHDPRVKFIERTQNGHISANSNSAAELATGEFLALLDHDDALSPHALYSIVHLLQSHPAADVIYSDEDKLTESGHRYDPQFKPDWSPDLLFSYNYINHFTCIRRTLFDQVGGFRIGYEGSQDHDLLLRVTEATERVHHIPEILYHWRAVQESTAGSAGVKPYVHTAGRRAVEDALARRGLSVTLFVPEFAERLGLPILAWDGEDDGQSVAIIVHGTSEAIGQTTEASQQLTSYRHYRIVPLATEQASAKSLNAIAQNCQEDYLLFLDAGLTPLHPRWLSRMLAHSQDKQVGALGARIRSSQGRLASCGTLLGMQSGIAPASAGHAQPADQISYYFYGEVTRTVSAVSRGCLLTPRATFQKLGGFHSIAFPRSLFDVDYCLRLRSRGLRSVQVGAAELQTPHSHDREDDPQERLQLQQAHPCSRDPYYSPSLSTQQSFAPSGDNLASSPQRTTPLRAWIAAHNLNSPEGAPRYLSEIILGLAQRKCLIPRVFSPLGGAGEKVYAAEGIPVSISDQPWSFRFVDGQWTPREYEQAQNHLIRELRAYRPDIVIANTLLTFPVIEAAARLGIPTVWIIHESYSAEVLTRLFPPLTRHRIESAFRYASRVIPASHDTAKLFQHWDVRGNFRVLHNGLPRAPIDEFLRTTPRTPSSRKQILAMGTVCERKGQHTLVEAAAILAENRSDFVVNIVGVRDVIPYAGYVRQLVQRRNLQNHVKLITETDEPMKYYRDADIFVCTSHLETFSRAVLEAEAFGLPIVSTSCCGISEQVVWNQNAFHFDFNDVRGLAGHLERLLSDDSLRICMGKRSRAMFENHWSYEVMLDRYAYVMQSACGGVLPGVAIAEPPANLQLPIHRLAG